MVNTLELRPWVPIDGIEHTKSSWEIADSIEFDNILDSSYEDETYINIFYSFINVPIGVKYYGRAKRHFNDGSSTDWTPPKVIEVTEDELLTTLPLDINIDTPMLYVNKNEIINNDSFTIESSRYRGKGDGHYSTTWLLYNDRNELIYSSVNDTVNKTSITINKNDLKDIHFSKIVIKCIHNSALHIESDVGSKEIVIYDVNFDIISNLNNVIPYKDYELILDKKVETNVSGVYRIDVLNMNNEIMFTKDFETDVVRITIPGGILETNSEYLIDLYVYKDETTANTVRVMLSTLELGVNEITDPEYQYKREVTYIHDVSSPLMMNGVTVSEMTSGLLPVIEDEEVVYAGSYEDSEKKISDNDTLLNDLNLENTDNENTYIKVLNNNKVVVDTKNDDGYPTFKIFNYNPVNKTVELVQTKVRDSEEDPIGKTNAIVYLDNDNFIYLPTNSDTIMKYNIPDNEIKEYVKVPNKDMKNGIIFYIGNNRVMIIGGSENSCYSYNLENKTFLETMKIESRFINRPLKVTKLINGDYIIVRTTPDDNDENGDIVYYDVVNDRMSIVNIDYDIIPYFDTSVLLRNGELLLIEYKDDTNKYFIFE